MELSQWYISTKKTTPLILLILTCIFHLTKISSKDIRRKNEMQQL